MIQMLAHGYLDWVEAWITPWYWVALAVPLFVCGLIGWTPVWPDHTSHSPARSGALTLRLRLLCLKSLLVLILVPPLLVLAAMYTLHVQNISAYFFNFVIFLWDGFLSVLGVPLVGYAMGFIISITYARLVIPQWSSLKRRFTVRQSGDELSDIRVETHRLVQKQFDPRAYYQEGHFFFGLDAHNNPIYERDTDWKTRNQRYVGPTQTGKGVLLGVQLDQAIRHHYSVIFIDPKPDPHARAIMRQACQETNRPFVELDLNDETRGTYEMFKGGAYRDRRARLFSALRLDDSGAESDFYRGRERAILDEIFPQWDGRLPSLYQLLSDDDIAEQTVKTLNTVREWLYLPSLNVAPTDPSLEIEDILLKNKVLYVAGSLTDHVVTAACTVMITEIIQETMRLNAERPDHMFLAIDEVAFLVSERIADALATVSSFRTNVCLAYQSEGDLLTGPDMNTNWKAVAKRIQTNSKIHLYYRAEEFETAQTIAEKSGTLIRNVTRSQRVGIGRHLEETWNHEREIHGVEEHTIHPNMALALPERVGILFRPTEIAVPLFTSWVPVDLSQYGTKPNPAEQGKETPEPPTLPSTSSLTSRTRSSTPTPSINLAEGLEPLNAQPSDEPPTPREQSPH